MGRKITVISTQPNVGINCRELNFRRTWEKKGTKIIIDEEKLQELMYDFGVQNLFKMGYLYTEDLNEEEKNDLGLEESGIILNDAQLKAFLTVKPLKEFEEILPKLTFACKENLIKIAKEMTSIDVGKIMAIKNTYNVDLVPAISLNLKNIM